MADPHAERVAPRTREHVGGRARRASPPPAPAPAPPAPAAAATPRWRRPSSEQHRHHPRIGRQRQHQRHRRAAAGGDDHAGQQQPRLRPAAVAMASPKTTTIAEQRPTKAVLSTQNGRCPTKIPLSPPPPPRPRCRGCGVGERIAQQHLHQGARGGEQAAAGEGGEGVLRRKAPVDDGGVSALSRAEEAASTFAKPTCNSPTRLSRTATAAPYEERPLSNGEQSVSLRHAPVLQQPQSERESVPTFQVRSKSDRIDGIILHP